MIIAPASPSKKFQTLDISYNQKTKKLIPLK